MMLTRSALVSLVRMNFWAASRASILIWRRHGGHVEVQRQQALVLIFVASLRLWHDLRSRQFVHRCAAFGASGLRRPLLYGQLFVIKNAGSFGVRRPR